MKFRILAAIAAFVIGVGVSLTPLTTAAAASAVPAYDHIVVLIDENTASNSIVGSSSAPYMNSLASSGANLTSMYAEYHPSQPNYISLFSGSNQGVTVDTGAPYHFSAENLAHQLIAAGKSFGAYSEGIPSEGYVGGDTNGYAIRHSPWVDFTNVPASVSHPFSNFPTDFTQLPSVSFVVPNLCNDMHDCSVSTGDTWMKNNMDAYAKWAAAHNSLLVTTWDENDYSTSGGNHIATFLDGANVVTGNNSLNTNHYGLLGMIEDSQGLARIGNAVGAPSWSGLFTTGGLAPVASPSPTPTPTATATATPTATPTATSTPTATTSGTCPADPGDGTTAAATLGWGTPVAGDEFNYTGAPDPAKWNVYVGAGNAGQGQRVASAINVNCGVATISGDANGNTGGMGAKFADQKYGRWEARIKTSTRDPKYHPVSILWPSNDVTTNCDEIDYAEGNNDTAHMNFFLHYACSGSDFQSTAQSSDWGTAWHNYAVEWSPSGITGYIDGVKWFTDTNPAHQPVVAGMHQTLQLDWFPDGSATTPTTMDTAWVRVYDVNASTPSPTPTATATPTPTATATPTPTPTQTQTPPPANVSVLLTPGATAGDYSCRTDYPAANSTCVLVIPPTVSDPASTLGQVHLDPGTDGRYTCTVDYPGYPEVPCSLTTQG